MTGRKREKIYTVTFYDFMDEEWRDKAFIKKRWHLQEEDLVNIVFRRILTPCWKRPDGVYMPLSYEISAQEEECAYHRWMNAWHPCNENNTRTMTEIDIRRALESSYIWFRQRDIDEAEQKGNSPLTPARKQKTKERMDHGEARETIPGKPEQTSRIDDD